MSAGRVQRMLSPTGIIAAIVLIAGPGGHAVPGNLQEPETGMPAAEVILERYLRVTGGMAAYRNLHNVISRGTFQVIGTTIRGKYAAYEAEPNKTHTIFDFESREKDEQGTLGDLAWELSSSSGARILDGEEKVVALREATFNSMMNWRSIYRRVECDGTESVGEHVCYRLLLHPPVGKPLTQYFDRESGLLLKSYIMLDGPSGEIRSENLYDDYRKVNVGVLFAHKLVHRIANQEMVVILDSVRCNVDMAGDRFDPPPAVKALRPSSSRR